MAQRKKRKEAFSIEKFFGKLFTVIGVSIFMGGFVGAALWAPLATVLLPLVKDYDSGWILTGIVVGSINFYWMWNNYDEFMKNRMS